MSRAGALVIAAAWAALALAGGRDALHGWVRATDLPALTVSTGREILARDGSLLRAYTVADGRWRLDVDPSQVDASFIALLKAVEDRRFDSHVGVDPLALMRAGWQALRSGRVVSGGSTLTMQVARLLEDSGTGNWPGKLRQIRVALALEERLTKAEILGLYLRLAPYGGNVEGVRAASLTWFGKEPRRLTAAEAALLVALPQSPTARRPDRAAQAARDARDRVLHRGVVTGVIARESLAPALTQPVPETRRDFPALAPLLADRLLGEAPDLRVRTTLDAGLQARIQDLAWRAVAGRGEHLSAAIIVADHRSGEILASAGSAGYGEGLRAGWIDMTRALRSPGSTLKPLVYALAFDEGLAHPETLIEDRPMRFGTYAPQNFDHVFRGTVRVREALQMSLNLPVVALAEAIGPARIMAAMRRAGMAPVIAGQAPGLALALGGVGVSLEDLTALYAGLAQGGRAIRLSPLPGEGGVMAARIVSPVAAWQVGDILSGLLPPAGAGISAGRIAYKTGTSYGHRDAIAVGFDGGHVIAVWLGRPDGTPVPGAFGGEVAAPVLFEAFDRLKSAAVPLAPPPAGTLLLSTSQLPEPLRRFRGRWSAVQPAGGPRLAFPPDGAEVELLDGNLAARVEEGTPPFTWLADGRPVALARIRREAQLPLSGGPVRLSVIDAEGRASSARITLR